MPSKKTNILTSAIGLVLSFAVVFVSIRSNQPIATAETAPMTVAIAPNPTVASTETTPVSAPSPTTPLTPVVTPTKPVAVPASTPATNSSGYTNGPYTSSVSYRVEHGIEGISVTLDLEDGVVTGASLSQTGSSPESERYQGAFASNYRSYVIGKKISSLNLSRVSGSSLTTAAFNNAVAQIKSQAAA